MFTVFPGALTLGAALLTTAYSLTDARVKQIDAELEARRH